MKSDDRPMPSRPPDHIHFGEIVSEVYRRFMAARIRVNRLGPVGGAGCR